MSNSRERKHSFWSWKNWYYIIFYCLILLAVFGALVILNKKFSLVAIVTLILCGVLIVVLLFWLYLRTVKSSNTKDTTVQSSEPIERNRNQAITEPIFRVNVERMESSKKSSNSIFYVDAPLPDLDEFYGRRMEYRILIDRIKKGASSSIVGGPKSGKTWLANYTLRKARLELDGQKVKIGYVDATGPACITVSGFVRESFKELDLPYNLPDSDYNLAVLDASIRNLIRAGQTPILFIDNFEALPDNVEFDDRFFGALRAITQVGLAIVAVSRESLTKLVSRRTKRSGFFNVFAQITLRPFDELEAEEFVHAKAVQAEFTQQEREEMLQYGRDRKGTWPPLRLQLVGNMLLERKNRDSLPDYTTPKDLKGFGKQVEKEYSVLST